MSRDKQDAESARVGVELFGHLFDAAPDGMIVVDAESTILVTNTQLTAMFGYTSEELIGRKIEVLVPEAKRGGHIALRNSFQSDAKKRPMGSGMTLHGRHKNGNLIPVEIMLSPLQSAGRDMVCAAVRDVSERVHAAEQMRQTDERLRSALESFHGAFAVFDADDHLVLCNSACLTTFGLALDGALIGRSYSEIVRANVATGSYCKEKEQADLASRWLAYHDNPDGSFELRTADGAQFRVVDRRTADGGTVSTAVDISADARREEELRAARATAEKASRAKSAFLASMSHELRTPLNAVLGFAQLLQRDKKNPLSEKQQERLQHVVKGGEHLLHLIDDILDLARIETGRVTVSVEPVDVGEVLAGVRTTLEPLADRAGIKLDVTGAQSAECLLMADRTRLTQILLNFGSNAIKYGRAGHATFRVDTRENNVRIAVSDDGIGIPEQHHDELFKPFARAGQETGPIEGTGIGLAICKRLAELMGGTVGFESETGKGSMFWVELPEPVDGRMAIEAPSPVSKSSLEQIARSLVVYVEDNPSNIAFMESFLSDFERIELITAPTAEIGLEIIASHKPDLVLMDLNLPGMSGFDATRRLQGSEETAHIPVVALSAAAMPRDRARAESIGFHSYLTKPVQVDLLAATLQELLGSDKIDG
jgi:PAS domain S-box-containing protein